VLRLGYYQPSGTLKHVASEDVAECVGQSRAHCPEHAVRQSSYADGVMEVKRNIAVLVNINLFVLEIYSCT
jgi:hypothetical protein